MSGPRCCLCGRFCGYDADEGTRWGSVVDLEPPDPDFWCASCAKREEDESVERASVFNGHWIKPKWERRAAERLGYVLAGPRGAAWSVWCRPGRVPADYAVRAPSEALPPRTEGESDGRA